MATPKLTLYVDIVSPFAYLAFHVLQKHPVFKQCEVKYVPVFLGGIMKETGNRPPITVKNKDKWINLERLRWARSFNIPILHDAPKGFPHNTVTIQRCLTYLSLHRPCDLTAAIETAWTAYWVDGQDITDPSIITQALSKAVGEEAKEVLAAAKDDDVKTELGKRTQEALDEGAFGLPWFVATNSKGEKECFWGFDHLGQVCAHLGIDMLREGGWRSLL